MAGSDEKPGSVEGHFNKFQSGSSRSPGKYTQWFSSPDAEALQPDGNLDFAEQPSSGDPNAVAVAYPGTLPEFIATQNQAPLKPVDPKSDTYSRVFGNQTLNCDQAPPFTSEAAEPDKNFVDHATSPVRSTPLSTVDPVNPIDLAQPGAAGFEVSNQDNRGDKATRLFSSQSAVTPLGQHGSPSAFTHVINSSDLRSAQENREPGLRNNPASASSSPTPPAQVVAPWPAASIPPSPIYSPQHSIPVQAPLPPPVFWAPPPPSFPAATPPVVPPQQSQLPENTNGEKWTAYLPLILGLNLLLLVAVIFILIVVWSNK